VLVDAETTLYYVPQGPGADCPVPSVSIEPIGLISYVGGSGQTYTAEPGWTTLTGTYEFNNGGTWSGSENFALSRGCPWAGTDDDDLDGILDSVELAGGLDPCDDDTDNDGIKDGVEDATPGPPVFARSSIDTMSRSCRR